MNSIWYWMRAARSKRQMGNLDCMDTATLKDNGHGYGYANGQMNNQDGNQLLLFHVIIIVVNVNQCLTLLFKQIENLSFSNQNFLKLVASRTHNKSKPSIWLWLYLIVILWVHLIYL